MEGTSPSLGVVDLDIATFTARQMGINPMIIVQAIAYMVGHWLLGGKKKNSSLCGY